MTIANYGVSHSCVHGAFWTMPCASCGRGYQSPSQAVVVDFTPVLSALGRIEQLLQTLVERGAEVRDGE